MGIKGLTLSENFEYISREDLCKTEQEGATVFRHRPIPSAVITGISDAQQTASIDYGDMQKQTFQQRIAQRNRECFRFGIYEISNYENSQGVKIGVKLDNDLIRGRSYPVVSEETMNTFPLNIINEVGNEIWRKNTMTEEGRKNLEALLSPQDGSRTGNAASAAQPIKSNEDAQSQHTEEEIPAGAAMLPSTADPRTGVTGTGQTPPQANG